MSYITSALLAAKLNRTLTTNELTYFTDVLSPAIDAYIDKQTGTTFGSTTPTTIYIDGEGVKTLTIPTMHSITEVKQDNVILTVDTAYTLYPKGSLDKLAIKSTTAWNDPRNNNTWTKGDENIAVTGVLGYTSVPADLKLVALELAVNAFNAPVNGYKNESVGDWSASYYDGVKDMSEQSSDILESYSRLSRRM